MTSLLGKLDPAPVAIHNLDSTCPYLFVCDHAGRAVPQALADLGLPQAEFERHIAWDIGAAGLSLRMGELLDACVIHQAYSRLVIDCNRSPGAPDSMPGWVDGATVPGNLDLTPTQAQARIDEIHAPYHAAIARTLDARAARATPTFLILVHSFTPRLGDKVRPWHFGVLHQHDSSLSKVMLELLSAEAGYVVGDNEPYAMDQIDYTAPRHARGRVDYCELETRQDLIGDLEGQVRIAALLVKLLSNALDRVPVFRQPG